MKPLPALIACVLLWPVSGWAQAQAPDPFTSARVHVGPFAVTPTLSVTNVGVDTNVFNELDNPKSDFTATITPAADMWLRLGPARLNLKLAGTYLFFAKYANQRGLGSTDSARLEFDLLHIRPWAGASFMTARNRPGYEIDARVRYTETSVSGGLDVPLSPRTTAGVALKRGWTTYDSGDSFLGYSLQDTLNRKTTTGTASLRYALTPLTSFVMAADIVQERFEFSRVRDSNGFRIMPGLEFEATALITGSARVGFRQLTMLTPGMPNYTGLVASVDLGYTLMGVTRFSVQVSRDVAYSFDPTQPYYLLTGVTGSVTQAVGGPWDVTARAGLERMAYQAAETSLPPPLAGRVDTYRTYGAGVGYKLGPSTLFGLNADYYTRRSELDSRLYTGLRIGCSVTYGF